MISWRNIKMTWKMLSVFFFEQDSCTFFDDIKEIKYVFFQWIVSRALTKYFCAILTLTSFSSPSKSFDRRTEDTPNVVAEALPPPAALDNLKTSGWWKNVSTARAVGARNSATTESVDARHCRGRPGLLKVSLYSARPNKGYRNLKTSTSRDDILHDVKSFKSAEPLDYEAKMVNLSSLPILWQYWTTLIFFSAVHFTSGPSSKIWKVPHERGTEL